MAINYLYKGIDLSVHNGTVDFEKVKKAGYDFVILRAGYGKLSSQKDKKFEENYSKAKAAGLEIGAYWYSYAYSVEEAILEAKACLECIKGKTFSFPVYYDVEESRQFSTLNRATLTKMANTFCDKIKEAGYLTGLYTGYYAVHNYFNISQFKYEKWLAKWSSNMGNCTTDQYGLWQYAVMGNNSESTISGYVPGCDQCSAVDMNYCFKDYPKMTGQSFNETVDNSSNTGNNNNSTSNNNSFTIKVGASIKLNSTPIYSAAGASKSAGSKTGTFYIYSSDVINGKIRITNSLSNVGRTPIGNYVTGWVKVSDLETQTPSTPTPKPSTPTSGNTSSLKAGQVVKLSNTRIYSSSTSSTAAGTKTGTFYIYSDKIINNRIRITNSSKNVGRTPIGTYVTGWVDVSSIK